MHYILRRLVQAAITVLSTITLSFVLIRMMPGSPVDRLRAQLLERNSGLSSAQIQYRIEQQTNIVPDEPLYVQYFDYMTSILTGDFGRSIVKSNQPVADILANAIPWTIFLMSSALFLGFVVGISLGAFMAYREGSLFDISSTSVSLTLNSTPDYIVGLLLLTFVAYQLGLFPTGGRYASGVDPGLSLEFFASVLYHGALPILSMAIVAFGGWALDMRGNSIRILGEDYLHVARLRGLPERRIALRYVARNAILPMYTGLMIAMGAMLNGSVILESIYAYPGLGFRIIEAVNNRDYPVLMGCFIVITCAIVIGILIADLTYSRIDPRAKGGDSREAY
ncbi:ABC transporter permease [Haloprofundus halobius]|uniref:ABC transporter permease n=1 Tax=Haloprofundus halobius TaxID=2876194 RepID=UPI001CCB8032|nr:ABC transporter permease [Haloprofundus halobius]